MDLRQIEYILKIAEENNITRAAQKLFISQSALNQQLLKLEKELGVQLFHRSRTNWRPTKAGEIYLEGACNMPGRSKVRISSWLGYEDLASYETFTARWHYFVKDMQEILRQSQGSEESRRLALYILQKFYVQPWDPDRGFFPEFEERLSLIRRAFS